MGHKPNVNNPAPQVAVSLEFDASLTAGPIAAAPLHAAVQKAVKDRFAELMVSLGIPGQLIVNTTALQGKLPAGRFLRLSVNGRLCGYPTELVRWVYSYMTGSHVEARHDLDAVVSQVRERSSKAGGGDYEWLAEFIGLTCLEIIKSQPGELLTLPQVDAYVASLPTPANASASQPRWLQPPNSSWLLPIFRTVLDLGISIADREKVVNILGETEERSTADVVEDLIVALRPDSIEIQLHPEYLKQITTTDSGMTADLFPSLRDGLFTELGVNYPPFHFVMAEWLKPGSFSFKLAHLPTLPLLGLQPDQCLVNDTVERLKLMNVEARPAMNPATGQPASIVPSQFKQQLEEAGLTTWDSASYLILTLAAALRQHSAWVIHRESVERQLDQLEQAFPALVKATKDNFSVEQITRVLRALVAEQISIRNLRLILERLLDYRDSIRTPLATESADSKQPTGELGGTLANQDEADLVAFVRAGMKRELKHKYSRGTSTVVVYLLAPEIERILPPARVASLSEEEHENILSAVYGELAHLPLTAQRPVLITIPEARMALRELIATEFPRFFVISFDDLPFDTNIQPVARISLTA